MKNCIERMKENHTEFKISNFKAKQKQPYEFKVRYAEIRAVEFYNECAKRGKECHVSVGGLDSITLLFFLRSIGVNVPAISVSSLEDMSIQKVHKKIGVESVLPMKRADGTTWNKKKSYRSLDFRCYQKKLQRK